MNEIVKVVSVNKIEERRTKFIFRFSVSFDDVSRYLVKNESFALIWRIYI